MPMKSRPFTLRLDIRVRDALEIAAERDSRSVGNLLEKIAAEWLKTKGYLESDGSVTNSIKRKRP